MTTTFDPASHRDEHGLNLFFVLALHLGLGFFWLFALGGLVSVVFDQTAGIAWGLCAAVTWIIDAARILRVRSEPARAWGLTFFWWLKSFIAPLVLGFEVLRLITQGEEPPLEPERRPPPVASPPPPPSPPGPPTSQQNELTARLDDFARRLAGLENELRELRQLARTPAPTVESPTLQAPLPTPPPRPPQPPPEEPLRQPAPQAPPPKAPPAPPKPPSAPARRTEEPPRGPSFWDREVTFEDLFGAKALAWAGGVVTLLGIVFFFVLAVNRGWIGPVERVGLGALASLLVFGAGLWLHRAFGPVYSALSAAGAGIAGGYATLLAATVLYDLVPRWSALLLAAGIAAVATLTAIAWSSERIAGLGLIGATLAPAAIALQDGEWSAVGTAFAALMFAATATVGVLRRWQALVAVGFVASVPQAAGLIAEAGPTEWGVVAVAAAVWLLYLGAAVGLQLRLGPALASLPTTLILVGGLLAGASSVQLFEAKDEGWMLLAVAGVEALAAAALFSRVRDRDLSALLGVVALAIAAVGVAILLTGPALTIAWAAEAAVLAWLARRADELRYQVAALAYLVAATVHALFWEAPLTQLYSETETPASGVAAVVAVALAAAVFARYATPWAARERSGGVFAFVAPLLEAFRRAQSFWRSLAGWASGLAALYAASLVVLQVAQWWGLDDDDSIRSAFEWGHVAVTGLWALAGLAVIVIGHRWSFEEVRTGGVLWLAAVPLQVVLFDTGLDGDPRQAAFLVLAAAAAATGLLGRLIDEPGCHIAAVAYLAPVLVHAVFFEAPFDQLYTASSNPINGIVSVGAFVVAAAVVGYCLRLRGSGERVVGTFGEAQAFSRSLAGWTAALAGLYAASLVVLGLGQWLRDDSVRAAFDSAHVAVTGLWGLFALTVLALGHRRASLEVRVGGLAALGLVLLEAVVFDITLGQDERGWAMLVAGAALLAGALLDRLALPEAPAFVFVAGFVLASIALGVAGALDLTSGDWRGYSLLGVAGLYCAISAVVFLRDRDLSTLLWAPALVVAGYAATILVSGTWLVLAWAAAAAALAGLVAATRELRFLFPSLAFLTISLAHTLAIEAPPAEFFEANPDPADGVPALLFTIAAAAVFGLFSRGEPGPPPAQGTDYDDLAHSLRSSLPTLRLGINLGAALLAIYAGSLAILGLAEAVGGAGVATDFQRGHSGVSAFWGTIGLVALYVGLRRGVRWLRLAGFVLFGLALAKLFLYDLANLSSVTRALSFLAVGAVLLFGGFLVQRLGAERNTEPA